MSVHYPPSSLHSPRIPYPPTLQQHSLSSAASASAHHIHSHPHHQSYHRHPSPPPSIPNKSIGIVERVPQKRRRRTTPAELAILEDAFKDDPLPDAKRRAAIASRIGDDMNPRNVQIWFQNRRQKEKNMKDTIDKIIAKHEQAGTNPHEEVALYTESQQQQNNSSHEDVVVENELPSSNNSSFALLNHAAAKVSKSPAPASAPTHPPTSRRPLEDKENIPPPPHPHSYNNNNNHNHNNNHYPLPPPTTVLSQQQEHYQPYHQHHQHQHRSYPYQSRHHHHHHHHHHRHHRALHDRSSTNPLRRSYSANSSFAWSSSPYHNRPYNQPPPLASQHRSYHNHQHNVNHLSTPSGPTAAALPSMIHPQSRRSSVELTTTLDGSASVISTPNTTARSSQSPDYLKVHAPLISKIESDPPSTPDEDDESTDQFSRVTHSARAAPHIDPVLGTPKLHSSPFIRASSSSNITSSLPSKTLSKTAVANSSSRSIHHPHPNSSTPPPPPLKRPGTTCSNLARAPTCLRPSSSASSVHSSSSSSSSSRFEPRELARSISTSRVPFSSSKAVAAESTTRRSSFPPTSSSATALPGRTLQKTASLDVIASRQASAIKKDHGEEDYDDDDDEDDDIYGYKYKQQQQQPALIRQTDYGSYKRNSSCEISDTESESDDNDIDIDNHFQQKYKSKRPMLSSSPPSPQSKSNNNNSSSSNISKSSLQAILSPSVTTSPPTSLQPHESTMRSSQQQQEDVKDEEEGQEQQQQKSSQEPSQQSQSSEEECARVLLDLGTSFSCTPSPPSSQPIANTATSA